MKFEQLSVLRGPLKKLRSSQNFKNYLPPVQTLRLKIQFLMKSSSSYFACNQKLKPADPPTFPGRFRVEEGTNSFPQIGSLKPRVPLTLSDVPRRRISVQPRHDVD